MSCPGNSLNLHCHPDRSGAKRAQWRDLLFQPTRPTPLTFRYSMYLWDSTLATSFLSLSRCLLLVRLAHQRQHSDLSAAQSRSLPAGYVFRAKLILMLAGRVLQHPQATARPRRPPSFAGAALPAYGLEGLDTYHPGQKPRVLTPALRARILSPRGKARRRVHALELSQTGLRAGRQQRRRASRLAERA